MNLIGVILINSPLIGLSLFINGGVKAAFLLSKNDKKNIKIYLKFIELGLDICNNLNQKILLSKSLFKLCCYLIINLNSDSLNDRKLIPLILKKFLKIKEISNNQFELFFNELNLNEKIKIKELIESSKNDILFRKKASNLIELSSKRNNKINEWQNLEIDL